MITTAKMNANLPKLPVTRKIVKKQAKVTNLPVTNHEYFKIAETINGRVAMLAWDFGVLKDWCTGQTLEQQFDTSLPEVTLVSLILTFASFITLSDKDKEDGIWKKQTELINGRAAMLGITILTLYQIYTK